ncbi:MAG: hypothetical protein IPO37_02280 [Saprospiraceae bacterium]|nr:hypothetical protein [Saprospiraceae bacterium]
MARLLVFIIFLTFSFSGNAQLRIHAGGGVNFSNIDFKNFQTPKVNSATNYFISVRPELGITESISVGLDIQYSKKDTTLTMQMLTRYQVIDFNIWI